MKRCLLHIGAPKTGSTALQKFLATNRDSLRRLGLEYPDVSLRGYGHHDIAFVVGGGYPAWATPPSPMRDLEELTRELAEKTAGSESIVLSSEDFYLISNPTGVAAMLGKAGFRPADVRVVVYVRRQDEAHLSWYNQAVKAQGYSGTLAECIAETHSLWNYAEQLERWAAAFGADRLDVRLYRPLNGPASDIRRDFLSLAGVPADGFSFPDANENSRINAEILEFQRLINRLPLSPQQKRGAHKDLIELTAAVAGSSMFADRTLIGAQERAAILKRYAASNRAVARKYFRRDRLFDEALPKGLPRKGARPELDNEKLVYIIGWLLARRQAS
jgi:hypothetical protein